MKHNETEYVQFMGVKIDNINYEGISKKIENNIDRKAYICLTDTGNVIRASKDKSFSVAIKESLISIADGMPLVWYAKLIGCRKIERISGVELLSRLLKEKNGYKHFLLGDTEQTLMEVMCQAKLVNNKMRISGYSPPFKNRFDEADNTIIIDKVIKENPDIIWVSFGGGRQDKWMYQNVHKLKRGVMIGVGAAFKYYIGVIKIPPKVVQNLGFQWFTRLLHNPERIKSYFRTILIFVTRLPFELLVANKRKKNWK